MPRGGRRCERWKVFGLRRVLQRLRACVVLCSCPEVTQEVGVNAALCQAVLAL